MEQIMLARVAHFDQIGKSIVDGDYYSTIDKLKSLAPSDQTNQAEIDFLLGCAYRLAGENNSAFAYYRKAVLAETPHLFATRELASMIFDGGFKREAISLVEYVQNITEKFGYPTYSDELKKLFSLKESFINDDTIISIHQPVYLPWLGYLHKIYYSDKFVIHDDAQFTRKSFIKRALIKKWRDSKESSYLSVPAKKHSARCCISELIVDDSEDWRQDHLRKIHAAYSKTEYFSEIFPKLESSLADTQASSSLVDVTSMLLFFLLNLLGIEREIIFASNLSKDSTLQNAQDRNLAVCKMLGGSIYFSGTGAKKYQDQDKLPEDIKLIYQDIFSYLGENPYLPSEQFLNGLSTLDALFCVGPKKIIDIFKSYENPLSNRRFSFGA